jgi:hypothetical protein
VKDPAQVSFVQIRNHDAIYLHVVALVIITALAEEPVVDDTMNVELVKQRVTVLQKLAPTSKNCEGGAYLGNRGGEDDNFIQLAYPLHELVDTWSLDDIYVVVLAFNLNGDGEIGLV